MNPVNEVLATLEASGTAQNRKIYARHGVTAPMFGVSYAIQKKLARQLGKNPALAWELWESGNHDARVLATRLFDPASLGVPEIRCLMTSVEDPVLGGDFAQLVARTEAGCKLALTWSRSRKEWVGMIGYATLSAIAGQNPDALRPHASTLLEQIEVDLVTRPKPNFARHAANGALIAIGGWLPEWTSRALEAAVRIGKVEIDHGETSCQTPDAAAYIRKMVARRRDG